jgi:hypothetical protein
MMLLERREQVELERDARVAGGHDPVVDELAGAIAAEMAIEAFGGARAGIIERIHARRDIGGVVGTHRIMARQPVGCAAVAALATDAVALLETRPTPAGAVSLWQPRHIGAEVAEPRPSRFAIAWLRALPRTAKARLCAPPGLDGSCQRINSSWRTILPSASCRPWQVDPLHEATPTWTPPDEEEEVVADAR